MLIFILVASDNRTVDLNGIDTVGNLSDMSSCNYEQWSKMDRFGNCNICKG